MPVKPKTAAMIETTRKIRAHLSNDMTWFLSRQINREPRCLVPIVGAAR
jgi:hypothetical protein